MDVVFMGTNGWYDTDTGNTLSILVRSKDLNVVLDAGGGLHKLDLYADLTKPTVIMQSHHHLDHLIGLHQLARFPFKNKVTVVGITGTEKILHELLRDPFTVPLELIPYPIEILEVKEEAHQRPFVFHSRLLFHSSPCLGYRLELDGRTIAFCTDTGPCKNTVELARNVDLLITESAFRTGEHSDLWPHLTPEDALDIKRQSGAKRLVLTHFDAYKYPTIRDREEIEERYPGQLMVSKDDMIVKI
ncbi:MAG: MBL fold metallo-hydrolase [Methanomassiliicoccales archaeon]|nr:MBL fold metallo-hydrolase [Methanomassiliicoccales archaeon]